MTTVVNRGWFDDPRNLPWVLMLFALAHFGAVSLGFEFYFDPETVATFWPASGLLLGALVVSRTKHWGTVILVALVAKSAASGLVYGVAIGPNVLLALAEATEALIGAIVLRRLFGSGFSLTRIGEVVGLTLAAGLFSTALSALAGAAILTRGAGGASYWQAWQLWWLADAMGVLLVAPLVILFTERTVDWLRNLRGWALFELATVVTLVLALQLVFGGRSPGPATILDVPYVVFPVLVWAAVRLRPWMAAACTFMTAIIVVWNADLGRGPFVLPELSVYESVLAIQTYLTVAAFSVLALCAALAQGLRSEAEQRKSDTNYRTLFKSATDGVLVMQRNRMVDCNDRILQILNLSREEILGKTPWELSPPTQADGTDSEKKAREIIASLRRGRTGLFEWRHLKGDGGTVDFEIGIAAAQRIDGEPLVFSHLRDITERKRAERETRERLQFETLMSGLSARFVNIAPEHVDDLITDSLRGIVEHVGLDRSTITQRKGDGWVVTHFWARTGIPDPPSIVDLETDLPYLFGKIMAGESVVAPELSRLPPEAAASKKLLGEQGQRALFAYPLKVGESVLGLVSFGSFSEDRELPSELVQRLRLAADVFANALARKQAEQDLRDSEERFRAVFEVSQTGLSIRRLDDISLVAANPAIAKMTGYTVEEFIELPPEKFLTSESMDRRAKIVEALRAGKTFHFDSATAIRKDGSTLEFEGSFVPFSHKGTPHALGVIHDVTEQKRTESALRLSEEKFSRAFDASPDVLTITSLEDGRILDVNQGFVDSTGYSREEAIGRTTVDLDIWVDPSDRERVRRAISDDDSTRLRCRFRMKSGEERIGDLSVVRLDVSGEARFLTVGRDITDQERDRASLKASEEKFFKAFHASPSMITITSLVDGRLMEVNRGWVRGTGYSREDSIGKTTVELDLWKDPRDRARIIQTLEKEGEVSGVQCRLRPKDGQETVVEISAVPLNVEGEPRYLTIAHDVTGRVRAERQQKQSLDEIARLKDELEQERDYLREEVKVARQFGEIVGESPALREMLSQVEAVAATDASVFVQGESGVGKELVAAAIHARSSRGEGPLVRVNCASIPRELFESEFFGHVKGAFTGAHRDRVGRFQLAHRGTLFLDEIAEIPMELQPKLLRALQEGEVQRVGEEKTRKVDVRVIAATNRDIDQEIRKGRFRQDLYYRLNVFPLLVPPLRERGDDIVLLARYFTEEVCRQLGREPLALSKFQAEKLHRYSWPGNIRELRNAIERAVILSPGKRLQLDIAGADPGPEASSGAATATASNALRFVTYSELQRQERDNLIAALDAAGWKVSGTNGAAERLGVKASTLASKMKVLGIKKPL